MKFLLQREVHTHYHVTLSHILNFYIFYINIYIFRVDSLIYIFLIYLNNNLKKNFLLIILNNIINYLL